MSELLRELKERKIELGQFQVRPDSLAGLLKEIEKGTISGKMAKSVFSEMAGSGRSAAEIISEKGLAQITDEEHLTRIAEEVLKESPLNVKRYREGEEKLFDFFVGQVMKKTEGKANPELVNEVLKASLSGRKTKL